MITKITLLHLFCIQNLLPVDRSLPFVHLGLQFLAIQAYPRNKKADHKVLQIHIFKKKKKIDVSKKKTKKQSVAFRSVHLIINLD